MTVSEACTAGRLRRRSARRRRWGCRRPHRDARSRRRRIPRRRPGAAARNRRSRRRRRSPDRSSSGRFARPGRPLPGSRKRLGMGRSGLSRTAAAETHDDAGTSPPSAPPPVVNRNHDPQTRRPDTPPVCSTSSRRDRSSPGHRRPGQRRRAGQQRRFGFPDRVGGVVVPHRRNHRNAGDPSTASCSAAIDPADGQVLIELSAPGPLRQLHQPVHVPGRPGVFGFSNFLIPLCGRNSDIFRFALERLPREVYLSSYYQRWLAVFEEDVAARSPARPMPRSAWSAPAPGDRQRAAATPPTARPGPRSHSPDGSPVR